MATFNSNKPVTPDTTLTAYEIPLSAIAQWPLPNYTNPERRHWFAAFAFCVQVVTTLCVSARIWARITRQAGSFGTDDVLIIGAWIFGTSFTGASIYGELKLNHCKLGRPNIESTGVTAAGFDRHVWDVPFSLVVTGGFVSLTQLCS
jgi:hypothetical protein